MQAPLVREDAAGLGTRLRPAAGKILAGGLALACVGALLSGHVAGPGAAFLAPLRPLPAAVRAPLGDLAMVSAKTDSPAPTETTSKMPQPFAAAQAAAAEMVIKKKVADKMKAAQEKYDIPDKYMGVLNSLFQSYMVEVYKGGNDVKYYETVMTDLFTKFLENAKGGGYEFEPYHKAIREPYDYYKLGVEFLDGVVDTDESVILGMDRVKKIREQVAAGENVVFLSNHQSEGDPQVLSVLLDPVEPGLAENMIFIAGDRVTTDLFAQIFSMGRNLLCIFSKKHIDSVPELKSKKTKHNKDVMKKMKNLFGEGGKVIWVAPSGGRDRKGEDGEFKVANFDPKSVEMFRLMANKGGTKTHFYPLSMLTYTIAPPPDAVGGAVGEERKVAHGPAGLAFGEEIDLEDFLEACEVGQTEGCDPTTTRDEVRNRLSAHIQDVVTRNYDDLEARIGGKAATA